MLGYVIIASETPFQAARWGAFPRVFARVNKHGAPIVTIVTSVAIIQLFLVLSAAAESTYQFFYTISAGMILLLALYL